jgi:hypothetical protein
VQVRVAEQGTLGVVLGNYRLCQKRQQYQWAEAGKYCR